MILQLNTRAIAVCNSKLGLLVLLGKDLYSAFS